MSLLDEIIAKCPPELLASRDHGPIAAAVSEGRTRIISRLGGIGAIIETLGPVDGPALLDALEALKESNPAVKWGWVLIERGELDFGSAVTRGLIQSMAQAGVMSQESAQALLDLALVPDPVGVSDVIQAMEGL